MDQLVAQLRADLSNRVEPTLLFPDAPPPVQVIDCVLSLRRRYKEFVVPRVTQFIREQPQIDTCGKLSQLIRSKPTPLAFLSTVLRFNSPDRSEALLGVVEWLDRIQHNYSAPTERARLEEWAKSAKPQDYLTVRVKNFGIAGFQYLRMRFGADTVKPDVHINRYVGAAMGRTVDEMEAIRLLEEAARIAGVPARRIDGMVWEKQAGW